MDSITKGEYPHTIPFMALRHMSRPIKIWSLGPVIEFGKHTPNLALPIFSVASVEEAKKLLRMTACLAENEKGQNVYVSPELQYGPNLNNLEYFTYRLWFFYEHILHGDPKREQGDYPVPPPMGIVELVMGGHLHEYSECGEVMPDEEVPDDSKPQEGDPSGDPYLDLP